MTNACIDIDHDGLPELHESVVRTARKAHVCCECHEAIAVGRKYEDVRGLWDGTWRRYRTCARCANIRADFFNSYEYGGCVEAFKETHGFDYRDGLPAGFTPCSQGALT